MARLMMRLAWRSLRALQLKFKGTNQAIRNAMDAQAMIDTAEGALDEVVNIMQRMRELAVQASNDTNSTLTVQTLILNIKQWQPS